MIRRIRPGRALSGVVRVPGDKSISHRYAMLAAVAEGESRLAHFASGRDCGSTLDCLRNLGVEIRESEEAVVVSGRGLDGLQAPGKDLDAGNSGTTMRLLSGLLAGRPFRSVLSGDDSLRRRPMGRIVHPLRRMGADVQAAPGERPPLEIRGGRLRAIEFAPPVASAQVKSCILLAGLYADGVTAVEEPAPTRDHTEIALRHFGAEVRAKGNRIEVAPRPRLEARNLTVPGDISGAAFFVAAALLIPGSDLRIPAVGLNRRRRAWLDYLRGAGFDIRIESEREEAGEPCGDLRVRYRAEPLNGPLPAVRGDWTAALIDEIPVLAVLGSQVAGGIEIDDARELRVKESDRIEALAANLRSMGAEAEERPGGLRVRGPQRLRGARIEPRGDHRIAMAFAVAALAAEGETAIRDAECAEVSFPGFWAELERAGQEIS